MKNRLSQARFCIGLIVHFIAGTLESVSSHFACETRRLHGGFHIPTMQNGRAMENSSNRAGRLARQHERDVIRLCKALIGADSQNPPGDTRAAADVAFDFLSEVGCHTRVTGISRKKANLLCTIGNTRSRQHLILCSHLDVVPPGDRNEWKTDPFKPTLKDGRLYGRGAADAKGPTASMLAAFRILTSEFERVLNDKAITLALVCNEEIGGFLGAGWLIQNNHIRGSACLIGEPSYTDQTSGRVIIGERGLVWFRLQSKGKPAHASMPTLGRNAITQLLPVIQGLHGVTRAKHRTPARIRNAADNSRRIMRTIARDNHAPTKPLVDSVDHYTLSLGMIQGGTKTNVVPDGCECEVDIRIPIGGSIREAQRFVNRILTPHVNARIVNRSNPSFTPEDSRLTSLTAGAAESVLGRGRAPIALAPYTSDAHWFRELLHIPACTFGPGYTFHVYNEFVPVRQLVDSVAVYTSTALTYLNVFV
jgi:succinyl-diaminopimelate desuccinylase